MSEQSFTAKILNPENVEIKSVLAQLANRDNTAEIFKVYDNIPTGLDIDVEHEDSTVSLTIAAGTSADFEFFQHIYDFLSDSGAQFETCNLFLSSTGSTHTFETIFDTEIDFNQQNIVFSGFDEDDIDEMTELLEDEEADIQDDIDKNTNILIIGDSPDEKSVAFAQKNNITIMTEDHFWQCMQPI